MPTATEATLTESPPAAVPTTTVPPAPHWVKLKSLGTPTVVLMLVAAIVVVFANQWNTWLGNQSTQTTDDAQLRADVTPLSTKSSGIVATVAVSDFQRVKAGDLLVQLKDEDFRAQVDAAEAAVTSAEASLASLKSQRALQASKVLQAQADLAATKPDFARSELTLTRELALQQAGVSSKQSLEIAQADRERLKGNLLSRSAEIETQRRQGGVLDALEVQLKAEVGMKQAALRLARINLDYTRIVAPTDGIVGERKVRPGQLVNVGTQVISLVGTSLWVTANYKEIQLEHVNVGDGADVTVDGLSGAHWRGHVSQISPASGAMFALLPPDNATGNFTKIIQRIPVKISLEPRGTLDERLRAGMSVIATIKTNR